MKKFAFAIAGLLATTAYASAADLVKKSPTPIAVAPSFSWTGFYAGLNAGYATGESSIRTLQGGSWAIEAPAFQTGWAALSDKKVTPNGFTGGAQIGYNYQINAIVLGAEADINYLGLKKNAATFGAPAGFPGINYTWTRGVETSWVASIRPRLGVTFDRTLVYLTGGLALGEVEGNWRVLGVNGYSKAGTASKTRAGFTIGAGLEQAFTSNITAKLEYLYTDLGKISYNSAYVAGSTFAPPAFNYSETIKQSLKFHTVRVGLNYKF